MTIQTITRDAARREREELLTRVQAATGTDDREALEEMDLAGRLRPETSQEVSRLRTLDFLLDG